MKPERVLMVSEPGEYGVLIYVRNLIHFLHRRYPGIEVDFAYSSCRGGAPLRQLVGEVEAKGGATLDLRVGSGPQKEDLGAWWRLRRLIRRRKPVLIHAHSSKAGGLMRLNRIIPGSPPVLYSPHRYHGMSRRGGLKEKVFNAMERYLGKVGRTHNVSTCERDFALRRLNLPPRSAVLVFTGVDFDIFSPATPESRAAARRELGLREEGKLLITIGRDAYQKNFAPLYASLDRLLPGAAWSFAHAGAGADGLRARLSPQARGRVTTFTYLQEPSLLLAAADGFILTSRSEGFSLSALEALCCGLPLILTVSTGLLSIRRLGFPDVRWLPDPATAGDITSDIMQAISRGSEEPARRLADQRTLASRWFREDIQFEKLVRLYRYMAATG